MFSLIFRTFYKTNLIFLLVITACSSLKTQKDSESPTIKTFYQPDLSKENSQQLKNRFRKMHDNQVSEVVLQYTAYNDIAIYPSSYFKNDDPEFVNTFLSEAHKYKMQIWLGTYFYGASWYKSEKTKNFCEKLNAFQELPLREVIEKYEDHDSIAGWYLPFEIGISEWSQPATRECFLSTLKMLKSLTKKPIMIAPFLGSANYTPQSAQAFAELLYSPADIILLQDSVGSHQRNLSDIYNFLKPALADHAVAHKLGIVIELFEGAKRAPQSRIDQQITNAHNSGLKNIYLFEELHY